MNLIETNDIYDIYQSTAGKFWYRKGTAILERGDDLPAAILFNGDKKWFWGGRFHRVNGPAVETSYCQEWYLYGKRHRDNELPAQITYNPKCKKWFVHNKLHRITGPAVEKTGYSQWWYQGEQIKVASQAEYERWLKLRIFE